MLTIKPFSNYIPKPEMPLWAEKLGAAFPVSGLHFGQCFTTIKAGMIGKRSGFMSSRALQIVTQLSNAPEQTMTSQELAERIGVSAHTIKNEMPQVAQILNENGARLVSRRHKGYYVEVLDPEAYDTFSAVTSIRQMPGSMLNADRESRVRYPVSYTHLTLPTKLEV